MLDQEIPYTLTQRYFASFSSRKEDVERALREGFHVLHQYWLIQ